MVTDFPYMHAYSVEYHQPKAPNQLLATGENTDCCCNLTFSCIKMWEFNKMTAGFSFTLVPKPKM